jgi:hypothetical protein
MECSGMNDNWIAEFHCSGDWREVAEWLVRHNAYLARGMASFAASAARCEFDTDTGQPTARQIALLVSLRGGVEALMRLESMQQAEEPDEFHRPRCGARTWAGHPCRHEVLKLGSRCRLHAGRKGNAPHESQQRRLPPRLMQ